MVGHGESSAGSYLADPTSPIPSHCASIVTTSTLRVLFNSPGSLSHTASISYSQMFWFFSRLCSYSCDMYRTGSCNKLVFLSSVASSSVARLSLPLLQQPSSPFSPMPICWASPLSLSATMSFLHHSFYPFPQFLSATMPSLCLLYPSPLLSWATMTIFSIYPQFCTIMTSLHLLHASFPSRLLSSHVVPPLPLFHLSRYPHVPHHNCLCPHSFLSHLSKPVPHSSSWVDPLVSW